MPSFLHIFHLHIQDVKKEWPRTKNTLLIKMWNQNGWPRPPAFGRFDHHDLTAKHCYFRCSKSPDVDGIKLFNKDCQATKHCSFILLFCSLVVFIKILVAFIKNFDPINIRRSWAPKYLITMFCSEVIMFNQKQEALATHLISNFFQQGLLSSWPLLFYTWGVMV